MFFSKIVPSWKQTLSLASKREALLFLFSWLRTFNRGVITFMCFFWWLIPLVAIVRYAFPLERFYVTIGDALSLQPRILFGFTPIFIVYFSLILFALAHLFIVYVSLLSIRSSIGKKNVSYFLFHFKKFHHFLLLIMLFALPFFLFSLLIPSLYSLQEAVRTLFLATAGFVLLDSDPNHLSATKSLFKAARSLLYYLPIALCLTILLTLIFSLSNYLLSFAPVLISETVKILLLFFCTCGVSVLYVKMRHNNATLFL